MTHDPMAHAPCMAHGPWSGQLQRPLATALVIMSSGSPGTAMCYVEPSELSLRIRPARSLGSYPGRWRAYWGALALHRELPHELPACVFHRILTAMKNPERPASATDCITICDAARECEEAKQLGLPRHQDFGICRDKRGGKESANCDRAGHTYPPDFRETFRGQCP